MTETSQAKVYLIVLKYLLNSVVGCLLANAILD